MVLLLSISLIVFAFYLNSIDSYDYNIGSELHVNNSSKISPESLQIIYDGKKNKIKESIYYLGLLHLHGISVPINRALALENFIEAADLGHIEASTAVGVLLLSIKQNEILHSAMNQPLDQDRIIEKYLLFAANAGDTNGKLYLAKYYLDKNGYTNNSTGLISAYAYLIDIIQQDTPIIEAYHYAGIMREYGLGVEQDFHLAASFYAKAALHNYLESIYNLALMHAYGRGLQQNLSQSNSLFLKAATAGHAPSMYFMGVARTYGQGCSVDYAEALDWFERAVNIDDERVLDKALLAAESIRVQLARAREARRLQMSEFGDTIAEWEAAVKTY